MRRLTNTIGSLRAVSQAASCLIAYDAYRRHTLLSCMAIQGFKDKDTARLFRGERVPKWVNIERTATIKLQMLHAAVQLNFLKSPPNNRLEVLKKDRLGQHSIWINAQWRLCFVWTANGPEDVEICDYH